MRAKKILMALVTLFCLNVGSVVLVPTTAYAVDGTCGQSSDNFLKFPTWYKYLNPQPKDGGCELDFTFPDDIGKVLLAMVEILLRVGGLVSVAFVIYGGFKYIISQGEPENAKNARKTVLNAVIGVAIAASATVIVTLISGRLT
jgi:hypothetical protein